MEKHDHSHHHRHENDNCGCHDCKQEHPEQNWIRGRIHDDAAVISASCTLVSRREEAGSVLTEALHELAAVITEKGGIIGHIKATLESTAVEMFSLAGTTVSRSSQPLEKITLQLAAIVFFIGLDEMESMVEHLVLQRLQALAS